MKYDKKKEDRYNYWNNIFDGHGGYMLPLLHNEPAIIRDIILAFVDDGESLLDIGCASGGTLDWIRHKKRKIKYKGTDYAENFIIENKKRLPDGLWGVMDAREIKEKDKSWDIVVIYDVIDNSEGWEQALNEACRVAIDKVILVMWADNDMETKKQYFIDKKIPIIDLKINGCVKSHRMIIGLFKT